MNSPNILLIVLDSVRADATGLHTEGLQTTPYLDEFAAQSTVYTQARAPSSWSLPSHASIFTGVPAHSHQLHSTEDSLPEGHTIFEELSEDGYETGLFTENPFVSGAQNGLNRFDHTDGPAMMRFPEALDVRDFTIHEGVQQYREFLRACADNDHPLKSLWNGLETKATYDFPWIPTGDPKHPPGTYYSDKFLSWSGDQSGPWAACVNIMDAHYPFLPTEYHEATPEAKAIQDDVESIAWDFYAGNLPWWATSALKALYHDSIRDADNAVRKIIEGLREQGSLDDTLVVITSDHGEAFGEYSEVQPGQRIIGHNTWAHESQLHVPLLVQSPGQTTGEVEEALSSLTEFPDVVNEVRSGAETGSFEVDDFAFASVDWADTHTVHETYLPHIDLDVFAVPTDVVYQQTERGIFKTVRRGDVEKTFSVSESQFDSGDALETLEDALESSDARLNKGSRDSYDSDMKNRLRDLGYM